MDALEVYDTEQANKDDQEMGGLKLIDTKLEESKIVSDLAGRFGRYSSWRKATYETMWDDFDIAYRSGKKDMTIKTRNKINIPLGFDAVENAVSKINGLSTTPDKLFEVYTPDTSNKELAQNKQTLLVDQLNKSKLESLISICNKQEAIYGTAIVGTEWVVKHKLVYSYQSEQVGLAENPSDVRMNRTVNSEYKVTERRPNAYQIDIRDFFPEPDIDDIQAGMGFFVRTWLDFEEFQELCQEDKQAGLLPRYANGDKVTAITKSDDDKSINRSILGEQESAEGKVELLNFWGKYDLKGDGKLTECWLVVANRQTLVKAISNPYHHQKRPVDVSQFIEVPGKLYGIGVLEPVMTILYLINTMYRQRIDNVQLAINRMWKVIKGRGTNWTQFVSRPNGVLGVTSQDEVTGLDANNVTDALLSDIKQLVALFYQLTVPEVLIGSAVSQQVGTAKIQVNQAMGKFATIAKTFQQKIIKPIVEIFDKLNMQFLNDDLIIKTFYGELFPTPVTPEIIRTQVLFKFKYLDEITSRAERINQMAGFMALFGPVVDNSTKEYVAKEYVRLLGQDPSFIKIPQVASPEITPTIPQPVAGLFPTEEQAAAEAVAAQAQNTGIESGLNVEGAPNTTTNQ